MLIYLHRLCTRVIREYMRTLAQKEVNLPSFNILDAFKIVPEIV